MSGASHLELDDPVTQIPLIGPRYRARLEKLGIATVADLLHHYPSRYEDYSQKKKIAELMQGEPVTVVGTLTEIKNIFTRYGKRLTKATVTDETGQIELVWFNQTYLTKNLQPGNRVSLSGKLGTFSKKPALISPEYEVLAPNQEETVHTGHLVAIYPETEGLSSKWLRSRLHHLLTLGLHQQEDYLPSDLRTRYRLMPLEEALENIHFPRHPDLLTKAQKRLALGELVELQLMAQIRRRQWAVQGKALKLKRAGFTPHLKQFLACLPFRLTTAQEEAIREIFEDLQKEVPMNRLLAGDVGSGKTVVAGAAIYLAYLNQTASIYMAPTEILAQQHYQTLKQYLEPLGLKIGLLTGSTKPPKGQSWHLIVGTHALLYHLGDLPAASLVVIDEQHRFGVAQRALLSAANGQAKLKPHLLTMTATPIPRSLALTLYGDLDLSYLDEMPPGRKPVKTWVVPSNKRQAAYHWVRQQVERHKSQAFVVCPLIEESETLSSVKAVTAEYAKLQQEVFPNLRVGLLHGRLKAKEKDEVIEAFRQNHSQILLATPVVEVGIDIPKATLMIIEAAERFGLASLHQLRGRVGRGDQQSYCLLFTESHSREAYQRLKAMETISDGLTLAQLDLKHRGQGEIYGLVQHGQFRLKIASLDNLELVQAAKETAAVLLANPAANQSLFKKIQKIETSLVDPN